MKEYYFDTVVKAFAPEGFKPRTITIRGLMILDKADARKAEENALKFVKETLDKQNPNINLKYTAKATKVNYRFILSGKK